MQERQRDYAGAPRRYIPSLGPWDEAERQLPAPNLLEASKSVRFSILVAMGSLTAVPHDTITSARSPLRSHMTRSFFFPGPRLTQWCLTLSIRVVRRLRCCLGAETESATLQLPIPLTSVPFPIETAGV
jgi:hypothetical protein